MTTIDAFLTKWAASGAAERANAQLFVAELCGLLGVDAPNPASEDHSANVYVFEKTIPGIANRSKNFSTSMNASGKPSPTPACALTPPSISPWWNLTGKSANLSSKKNRMGRNGRITGRI